MNINTFKQTFLKKGIAKPTRYKVDLTGPGMRIRFQPETITLPSRGIATVTEQYYGPPREVPVGLLYQSSVVLTFPVSDDQNERTFFEQWMDILVNPHSQLANPYKDASSTLYGSMTINTLTSSDKISSTYTFKEVYPKEIMPTNLGQNMMNDYTRLTVSMEYRSYTYSAGDGEYKTPESFAEETKKDGEALDPIGIVVGNPTSDPNRFTSP